MSKVQELLARQTGVIVPYRTLQRYACRFDHGRWFVTWLKLEEDMSQAEAKTRELLVFEKDRHGRLVFAEV